MYISMGEQNPHPFVTSDAYQAVVVVPPTAMMFAPMEALPMLTLPPGEPRQRGRAPRTLMLLTGTRMPRMVARILAAVALTASPVLASAPLSQDGGSRPDQVFRRSSSGKVTKHLGALVREPRDERGTLEEASCLRADPGRVASVRRRDGRWKTGNRFSLGEPLGPDFSRLEQSHEAVDVHARIGRGQV